MNQLQQDVSLYVRVARKTRGQLQSFKAFNEKFNTNIPECETAFKSFSKSFKRAKANGEFPVQGRLYNLYSAFVKESSPVIAPQIKPEMIPSPAASLSPVSHRSVAVEETVKEEYTVADFKQDLEEWKKDHPSSKLNQETQIVYFVPHERVENYEHFASKLTKSTGAILEKGGLFKMRSGLKKEILGADKKVAAEIIASVTKGEKGPFFLPMACVTGAAECNC